MKEQPKFFLLLATTLGLLSGLAYLPAADGHHFPFWVFAIISIATASLIGLLRPPRVWLYAAVASLGLPAVVILRIVYDLTARISSHNLAPIEVFLAIVIGASFAFAGVALGIGLRLFRKRAAGIRTEWSPPQFTRTILISCLVGIIIAIPVYLLFLVKPEPPLEIGVHLGDGLFHKTLLISKPEIGDVTCIKVLPAEADSVVTIIVAGESGAMTLSQKRHLMSIVKFDERAGKIEPVDVDGDGVFEYMNRGGGWQPVSLISSSGTTVWKYSPADGPDDMTSIDRNGDGVMEFIVGLNGGGGLKALDQYGRELWTQSATNVFSVAAVDVDADGSAEIVHTDGGTTVVRSVHGDIKRKLELRLYHFAICRWPKDGNRQVLLGLNNSAIIAYDFNGKLLSSLAIPRNGRDLSAIPVRFGEHTFIAVAVSGLASTHLSMLYIFDQRDSLVYHDVFYGMEPTVAVIPAADEAGDVLLVGGADGTVAEYRLKVAQSGSDGERNFH